MKGFPNQISDLKKLSLAMKIISDLLEKGENPKDDGTLGEALIRGGVAGTGHVPLPLEEYLAQQKKKSLSNQSHRTTARGLRELFRILDLIDDSHEKLIVTPPGRQVAAIAGRPLDENSIAIWRRIIGNIRHSGGYGGVSHPYQVLLRLIASRPGITRAKCALALEARDDSPEELERIIELSHKDEEDIIAEIEEAKTNWDNAKKILPSFAEQLGDVKKTGQSYFHVDVQIGETDGNADTINGKGKGRSRTEPRRPRSSRLVNADTIAMSGTADKFDERPEPDDKMIDPEKIKKQLQKIKNRLLRHNRIVKEVARLLECEGAELFEHPFDCLAIFPARGILIEVKSLDGSAPDEVERVRDALAQLLYYESFVLDSYVKSKATMKIACFESEISKEHQDWLARSGIMTIWKSNQGFSANDDVKEALSGILDFI